MFEKHLWTSGILSKDAGNQPASLLEMSLFLPQVIFKHFASKNQPPAFYIRGTLAKNGLKDEVHVFVCIFSLYAYYKCIDYIITKCTSKFSKVLENDWNFNGN